MLNWAPDLVVKKSRGWRGRFGRLRSRITGLREGGGRRKGQTGGRVEKKGKRKGETNSAKVEKRE